MKRAIFLGDARRRLQEFPQLARRELGYQLEQVQRGRNPDDWKPMKSIGAGAFRMIYIANLADAVYVLHAFQKKTRLTSSTDLALSELRFRALKRSQVQ